MSLLFAAATDGGLSGWVGIIKQGVLLFFVLLFVGILLKLILTKSERYRRIARIPLDETQVVDPRKPRRPADPSPMK